MAADESVRRCVMTLTKEELKLLKELKAAGTRGRTISAGKPHDGLKSLVKAGYATAHGAGLDRVLYLITERGKEALATS
jgi:DNA-binding PadR family transcriptional regulator